MAVIAFEGTNTGNRYNVGQQYQGASTPSNPSGIKIAMSDGSFRNLTGPNSTPGSSQSATARFYHSSSGPGKLTGSGGTTVRGAPATRPPPSVGNPGGGGVVVGAPVVPGPGAPGVVQPGAVGPGVLGPSVIAPYNRFAGFFGVVKPVNDPDRYILGGAPLWRDPFTANVDVAESIYGEGDFLSPTWFIQWGAAATHTAHGLWNEVLSEDGRRAVVNAPANTVNGAVDFARYLDQRRATTSQPKQGSDEYYWGLEIEHPRHSRTRMTTQ